MRLGGERIRASSRGLKPVGQKLLAVSVAVAAIAVMYGLARLDGIVTKTDLIDFIAAVITAISFAITFALAVLAINAFSNYREIEEFKLDAERLRADLDDRARHADRMLAMLPWVIEAISARISELSPQDREADDVNYFRILHGRLFMKLLLAKDPVAMVDICRDIIGSMRADHPSEILDETVRILHRIRAEWPGDRDLIDPILEEAKQVRKVPALAAEAI